MHRRFLALTLSLFAPTALTLGQNAAPAPTTPAPAPAPVVPAAPAPSTPPAAPTPAPSNGAAPTPAAPPASAAPATPPAADGTTPAATPAAGAAPAGGGFAPGGGFPPGGRGGFGRRGGGGFGGPGGGMGGADGAAGIDVEAFQITGDNVMMQFTNNPVADLLAIYEKLTGYTLIKDTNIFEGATISLVTPKQVPKTEAIKLIEASLLANGYAIVSDPGGTTAKILPARNQSANAVQFSHGVKFFTSAKDIPDNESIVAYFMKLDYLSPEDAATMLSGHVGLGAYGRITAVTTPPGLLITESATVVKQLISIREAVDIGDTGSSLVTKFIPVKYADVAVVAQIIQATLNAQAQEKESKGVNTIRGNAASDGRDNKGGDNNNNKAPPVPGQLSNQQSQSKQNPQPSAQVVADTRLNQILVIAAPADYAYVASLIAEFDKPVEISEPFERKLKYASAIDVLSALVDQLQDVSTGTTQLPGGGTIQQQRQQVLATNNTQLLGGRNTTNARGGVVGNTAAAASGASDTASATTGTTGTTSSTGAGSRADVVSGPTENNAPVSILVGKTRVVADPMSNTILVMGRKEDADKAANLLDKLDRKPAQVYLATVIGELTLSDTITTGIDYVSALMNKSGTNFSASSITARQDILTGNATTRAIADMRNNVITTAFGPAAGLNLYGAAGDSLDIFLNALQTNSNFKVLSRPSIFALNNKKAVITSGRRLPYPQSSVTNLGNVNGTVTSTTGYLEVVLKLEVVPLINSDGEVSLTISQVNDTQIGTQLIQPNLVPIIGTEQLVTSVTVPDRNTIVLGGLISEEKNLSKSGIPFLSTIPGLGKLFRTDTNTTTRKELIVFIQPQVVADGQGLQQTSLSEDLRTNSGSDAAQRFPQHIEAPKAIPIEEAPAVKKKNFFQRMFSRDPKPQPQP